jgi:SAM-dependent methyltransferase
VTTTPEILRAIEGDRDGDAKLQEWLGSFAEHDQIRYLTSAKSFGGEATGEEEYAKQFSVDRAYVDRVARGVAFVLAAAAAHGRGGALEIGCGTGIFTRALLAGTNYRRYYISDMSPAFVGRTRAAAQLESTGKAVEYLVLSSEGFDDWPDETLSLVALRYVLHHVLDWRAFIAHAGRLLLPGGALIFEEPCADGYLLQAMMMKCLRNNVAAAGYSDQAAREIDFFISTISWYLRTGVDKTLSEDKHLFQPSLLFAAADEAGLRARFYPNVGFDSVAEPQGPSATYFVDEFRHNLRVNFGVSRETLELFEAHVAPLCADLQLVSGAENGPTVKGVFTLTKQRR